jgi:hypothetical protein
MSCTQQMDELVKEYLLFRGFTTTVRALDAEVKSEKDKAFRVRVKLKTILYKSIVTNNFESKFVFFDLSA